MSVQNGKPIPQSATTIPRGIQNTLAIEEQRLVAYLAARAAVEAPEPVTRPPEPVTEAAEPVTSPLESPPSPASTTVVLEQPFPTGAPSGDPVGYLRAVVAHITAYRQRRREQYPDEFVDVDFGEYLRLAAVLEAVEAHPEALQIALYDELEASLLDGTLVIDATPVQLRVDALALFDWARDGVPPRGEQLWLEAAVRVMARSSSGRTSRAA